MHSEIQLCKRFCHLFVIHSIKFSASTVYASFVMHVDCTTATQPLNKANYDRSFFLNYIVLNQKGNGLNMFLIISSQMIQNRGVAEMHQSQRCIILIGFSFCTIWSFQKLRKSFVCIYLENCMQKCRVIGALHIPKMHTGSLVVK